MAAALVISVTTPTSPAGRAGAANSRRRNAVPDLHEQIDQNTRHRLRELCRACFENLALSDDSDPEEKMDTFLRNKSASQRRNAVTDLLDVLNEEACRRLVSEYARTVNTPPGGGEALAGDADHP